MSDLDKIARELAQNIRSCRDGEGFIEYEYEEAVQEIRSTLQYYCDQLTASKQREAVLLEALEFYANNWLLASRNSGCEYGKPSKDLLDDMGRNAQHALTKYKEFLDD